MRGEIYMTSDDMLMISSPQVQSYSKALEFLIRAKTDLGETLAAFEFMDRNCIEALRSVNSGLFER
jgi:hypothetical protein